MESLTTFSNEEDLEEVPPPYLVKITSSRMVGPPQGNAAVTGPVGFMLENHSQQPMVRDSQKPQPPARWQLNKPLQLGRSCHKKKVPIVNGLHPHQGLQRLLDPCMGITHQGYLLAFPQSWLKTRIPFRWWGPPCSPPGCSRMKHQGPCVLTW